MPQARNEPAALADQDDPSIQSESSARQKGRPEHEPVPVRQDEDARSFSAMPDKEAVPSAVLTAPATPRMPFKKPPLHAQVVDEIPIIDPGKRHDSRDGVGYPIVEQIRTSQIVNAVGESHEVREAVHVMPLHS